MEGRQKPKVVRSGKDLIVGEEYYIGRGRNIHLYAGLQNVHHEFVPTTGSRDLRSWVVSPVFACLIPEGSIRTASVYIDPLDSDSELRVYRVGTEEHKRTIRILADFLRTSI